VTVPSDEALLSGMAAGDTVAAAALVRRYQARVYGLALTIVGDRAAAEDVAQEAFLKSWRYAASYDARRGRVDTWLLTITRNTAIDAVRHHREEPIDTDVLLARIDAEGHELPADPDPQLTEHLRAALLGLPPNQVRPLALMVFYGLTARQIGTLDDVPLGTVKTRVRRALRTIRQQLGVHDA
jgi:RNA polymerase sigma factor (sigma-70 family)